MTKDAWGLIKACERHGLATQPDLRTFLKEPWRYPAHRQHHGRDLWRIFDDYGASSNEKGDTLKCGQSELLSLYGLLRCFFERRVGENNVVANELQSFKLSCRMVDLILMAKRGTIAMAEAGRELHATIASHREVHVRTYGTEKIVPKHHWASDIADAFLGDQIPFDSAIIERLHLRAKATAANVKNLQCFERSVVSGIMNAQARMLEEDFIEVGLCGKTAPFPGHPGARVGDNLNLCGFRVAVGDYVFRGESLGRVLACCCEAAVLLVVVNSLERSEQLSPRVSQWHLRAAERQVWRASALDECLAWQVLPGDLLFVLRL